MAAAADDGNKIKGGEDAVYCGSPKMVGTSELSCDELGAVVDVRFKFRRDDEEGKYEEEDEDGTTKFRIDASLKRLAISIFG